MKTYQVKMEIRAECVSDAEELLNDYTGTETDINILEVKEIEENKSEEPLRHKIINLIKDYENKGGIFLEELKSKIQDSNLDSEIIKLLEEGIIFEPHPTKLRWLG